MSLRFSRLRVILALLALVCPAVLTQTLLFPEVLLPLTQPERRDPISPYVERYDGLKALLPPGSTVGYLTDRHDVWEWRVLTQYALTPVIVEDRTDPPLVVGDFHAPGFAAAGLRVHGGHVIVRDFGNGVVLLARRN